MRVLERGDLVASAPYPKTEDYERAERAKGYADPGDPSLCARSFRLVDRPEALVRHWKSMGDAHVVDVLVEATRWTRRTSFVPGKGEVRWVERRDDASFDALDDKTVAELLTLSPSEAQRLGGAPALVALRSLLTKTELTPDKRVPFALRAACALASGDYAWLEPVDYAAWTASSRRAELAAAFGERAAKSIVAAIREAARESRKVSFDAEMKLLCLVGGEENARAIAELIDYRPVAKHAAAFFEMHPKLAPSALGSRGKKAEVVLRATTKKRSKKLAPFVTDAALSLLPVKGEEAIELVELLASEQTPEVGDLEPFAIEVATTWHALGANMREKWPVRLLGRLGTYACIHWLVPVAKQWGSAGLRSGIALAVDVYRNVALSDKPAAGLALMQLAALADSSAGPDDGIAGAAFTALESIAHQLALDADMVRFLKFPTFGLDATGTGVLGGVKWSVDSDLRPSFDESTTLTKNIRLDLETFLRLEERRLFHWMLREGSLDWDTFRVACIEHPIRRAIAARLVWSIDGMLVRIAEDGTLEDIDRKTHVPLAGATASIPHPVSMKDGVQREWASRFHEYRIVSLFDQLGRDVFHLGPSELEGTELPRFVGRKLDVESLRAGPLGWHGSQHYIRWNRFIVECDHDARIKRVHAFFRKPLKLATLRPAEISEVCLSLERATS